MIRGLHVPNHQLTQLPNCIQDRLLQSNKHLHSIRDYYLATLRRWGPQNWWPAESCFEVIVGAYLTQNTAWANVEKAMNNLRGAQVLSVKGIREIAIPELEELVR